jgi:F0F1-type ATP synthase membrane subunit a
MIGTQMQADTSTVRFTFDPLDYKVGALLSLLGVILVIFLLFRRKGIDVYFSRVLPQESKRPAGNKRDRKK